MGLDWNPGNKPKGGYEAEFRDLLASCRQRNWNWPSKAAEARYHEISITPYDTLNAPTVGVDPQATEWARSVHDSSAHGAMDDFLKQMHGFRVVVLCEPCDGIPRYSNGSPGGYVEPFSFRAQFLTHCAEVIGEHLLTLVWENKETGELKLYGNQLLDAVTRFADRSNIDLDTAFLNEDSSSVEFHADVVFAAAKWCLFWSAKGHMLDAYY